ncbi:MAG: hypothetical protein K1X35_14905 [Caulobacteraceae bacterium]|nr:hypothetical protein [Caulobacteraceae bacterium]
MNFWAGQDFYGPRRSLTQFFQPDGYGDPGAGARDYAEADETAYGLLTDPAAFGLDPGARLPLSVRYCATPPPPP